ncbi:glycosyltransferase family 4 protein [Roseiconus nitratireducens]|nr:glycosyltransferase family 4 protein [Roseiconus nitratireducens]
MRRGVRFHTVGHSGIGRECNHFVRHTHPRKRKLGTSFDAVWSSLRYRGCDALASNSVVERIELVRIQRSIERIVRAEKIDLIHSHWARPSGTAGALAKRLTGVPLVITLRGADVFEVPEIGYGKYDDAYFRRRLRYAFQMADRIIGISSAVIERAHTLGAIPSKTCVIHKGVDHESFSPGNQGDAKQRLDLSDAPTILFVGNLGPQKGVRDLLEAFQVVRQHVPETRLVICGKGPLEEEIQEFRDIHGLKSHLELRGFVGRSLLPSYFQACDVFVLPSVTEAAGNVLLEAAACERPAVGSRVGGIPEYISDGETGLLCEPRNPGNLAERILCLLRDSSAAAEMGRKARVRVVESFSFDRMVDQLLSVYRDVL